VRYTLWFLSLFIASIASFCGLICAWAVAANLGGWWLVGALACPNIAIIVLLGHMLQARPNRRCPTGCSRDNG